MASRSDWPVLTARALPAELRQSADEQEPRAPSDAVVERTVREGIRNRNRLGDAFDEEPGVGERIDDRADWAVVEAHPELPAALPPGIGEQHRLEVRSGGVAIITSCVGWCVEISSTPPGRRTRANSRSGGPQSAR